MREELVALAMAGHARGFTGAGVDVDRVAAALTEQHAAVPLQMPDQIDPLHAGSLSGSRMTSAPVRSSSARARFAASVSSTA